MGDLGKKKWLTTKEAAYYLGKSVNAVWILVSRGMLMRKKWQGRLYFKRSELDHLISTSFS